MNFQCECTYKAIIKTKKWNIRRAPVVPPSPYQAEPLLAPGVILSIIFIQKLCCTTKSYML